MYIFERYATVPMVILITLFLFSLEFISLFGKKIAENFYYFPLMQIAMMWLALLDIISPLHSDFTFGVFGCISLELHHRMKPQPGKRPKQFPAEVQPWNTLF